PAVLTERGLAAAIDSLRDSAAIDVRVASIPAERLPEPVEAAAYYIVVEALTNAAKHAAASEARVAVTVESGIVEVEVADDGIGGADPAGSGLRGVADRGEAPGGALAAGRRAGR